MPRDLAAQLRCRWSRRRPSPAPRDPAGARGSSCASSSHRRAPQQIFDAGLSRICSRQHPRCPDCSASAGTRLAGDVRRPAPLENRGDLAAGAAWGSAIRTSLTRCLRTAAGTASWPRRGPSRHGSAGSVCARRRRETRRLHSRVAGLARISPRSRDARLPGSVDQNGHAPALTSVTAPVVRQTDRATARLP